MSVQISDLELLESVREFALRHPHKDVSRFAAAMRDWGEEWQTVESRYLPAAGHLDGAPGQASGASRELLALFERQRHRLCWEQSYRRDDRLVPESMLDGYAFAEIIGKRGPFVSERIRAGIGIWGPGIDYPRHRHQAQEVYIPLAGSAEFSVGDTAPYVRRAGDVVYVESNTPHGFRTGPQCLIVYYLWQAGDLRQTSTFG